MRAPRAPAAGAGGRCGAPGDPQRRPAGRPRRAGGRGGAPVTHRKMTPSSCSWPRPMRRISSSAIVPYGRSWWISQGGSAMITPNLPSTCARARAPVRAAVHAVRAVLACGRLAGEDRVCSCVEGGRLDLGEAMLGAARRRSSQPCRQALSKAKNRAPCGATGSREARLPVKGADVALDPLRLWQRLRAARERWRPSPPACRRRCGLAERADAVRCGLGDDITDGVIVEYSV